MNIDDTCEIYHSALINIWKRHMRQVHKKLGFKKMRSDIIVILCQMQCPKFVICFFYHVVYPSIEVTLLYMYNYWALVAAVFWHEA